MIKILFKSLLFKMFYRFGFPKILPMNYTISLLYACNSRCKTCNIYKKKARVLQPVEYRKIFNSIKKSAFWITFSGGEPFLRNDLFEICCLAATICKPKIINIPTNGILTEKIVSFTKKITIAYPKIQFNINLSIDEIGAAHDEIRGVRGNYEKVIKTFYKLKQIGASNLQVGIHTVISKFNVKNFPNIASTLMQLNPDSYITEIAEQRVELWTKDLDIQPKKTDYAAAADFLIHRIKHSKQTGWNKLTQLFRCEYYSLVKKVLKHQTQVIDCLAGVASAQIAPDGRVWACCIRAKSVGSLRANRYNFSRVWFSDYAKKHRLSIKNRECYCPLANASYTNILMNYSLLAKLFVKMLFLR